MATVTLPSAVGATSMEQVINAVEKMRKDVEFLFAHLNDDNISKLSGEKVFVGNDTLNTALDVQATQISLKATTSYVDSSIAPVITTTDGLDTRLKSAEGSITVQAGQISSKVAQTDYNGNTIASLINQSATTISINASKIDMNGYVTFSSLSTPGQTVIDGGNVTGGTITGSKWKSSSNATPFEIYIGPTVSFKAFTVYNGAIHLYSITDTGVSTEIFTADTNGVKTYGDYLATQTWVSGQGFATQSWVNGKGYLTAGQAGDVYWWNTYSIQRGGSSLKFIYGRAAIQARDYNDTAYGNFEGNAYSNVSRRDLKKDIENYENDALSEIAETQVYTYRYNEDLDTEPKRVGLIFDEAPLEIMMFSGGVDIYGMAAMLWKAVQQLNEKVKTLGTT